MKILHLIAGDLNLGAAKGALYLHAALLDAGIDSIVLNNALKNEIPSNQHVFNVARFLNIKGVNLLLNRLDKLITKLFYRNKIFFSPGIVGYDITKHPLYKKSDIIHLHFITNGLTSIHSLDKIKKPIVWTIRDMWPMTGGCHYSLDCSNYTNGCGSCYILNSQKKNDLSSYLSERKRKIVNSKKKIQLITISKWLEDKVSESSITKKLPLYTIYNQIDFDLFTPFDKIKSRKDLGLPENKSIVLIGAINLNNPWKGFYYFLESLKKIEKHSIHFVFFGKSDLNDLNINYTDLGYIHDTTTLSKAYSAADVFVCPSLQEAFGKTCVESLANNTPVVCFDSSGGPSEIVIHKENGYKAKYKSTEDLAKGIEWCIKNLNSKSNHEFRINAKNRFSKKIIASDYIKLYKKILDE